jgi:ribosomal protein S18 acetylase RimI-like enzyme
MCKRVRRWEPLTLVKRLLIFEHTNPRAAGQMVGLVVARTMSLSTVEKEDADIISTSPSNPEVEPQLLYIMTVGVVESHRHRGVGSELLARLQFVLTFSSPHLALSFRWL